MASSIRRSALHLVSVAAALLMAACSSPERRTYDVHARNIVVDDRGDTVEIRGELTFARDGGYWSATSFVGSYDLLKGPAQWRTESWNMDGQHVVLEHDDDLQQALITVDDYPPRAVLERADGKYEYDHRAYQQADIGAMAEAIADDLEAERTRDDSVITTFTTGKMLHDYMARTARRKLFFAFAFVDIYNQIQAAMNIGANNVITQE